MKSILCFSLAFLTHCGASLKQDPSMSVVDAKYPSIEFEACGLHNGLGLCDLKPTDNFSFKVQGYYNGTLMVAYGDGREPFKIEYRDNEKMTINVGELKKSLVIKLYMTPKYEAQESAPFPISGLHGTLYLKVLEEFENKSFIAKVPENADYQFNIPVSNVKTTDVFFQGCGGKLDNLKYPVVNSKVTVNLSKIVKLEKKDPCTISGAVDGFETTMLISMYDKHFTPLSIPYANINNQYLDISANEVVSIISLDEEYKVNSKGSFKFDKDVPHILRTITSAGRIVLGHYENGVWKWLI